MNYVFKKQGAKLPDKKNVLLRLLIGGSIVLFATYYLFFYVLQIPEAISTSILVGGFNGFVWIYILHLKFEATKQENLASYMLDIFCNPWKQSHKRLSVIKLVMKVGVLLNSFVIFPLIGFILIFEHGNNLGYLLVPIGTIAALLLPQIVMNAGKHLNEDHN